MDRGLKTICGIKHTLEKQRMLRRKAYNIAVERNKKEKNEEVNLLLNQFYIGVEVQNELLSKCIELGWMEYE